MENGESDKVYQINYRIILQKVRSNFIDPIFDLILTVAI